ncbi:MAG: hypothetical protein CMB31_04980 [Euryarchaeota archaeon]|nr:hypothetical protein [Euryarchaeota archaeon]
MNYLEVSYIGSACDKNRYEPVDKTILLLLCRNNPKLIKRYLFLEGIIIESNKKTYDNELKNIYSEYKKNITDVSELEIVKDEIIDKLKNENEQITEEDVSIAEDFLQSSLKKDCGINNENPVIKRMKYTKGNNKLYKFKFNDSWELRGFHDACKNDVVIEIKTRMKMINVRKNEYDLYQLFGYLLVMGKTRGKIVQKYGEYIFDSDIENNNEYGLIDITGGKWKTKFNLFKFELSYFFDRVDYILEDIESRFYIKSVFKNGDIPVAKIKNGVPGDIHSGYEKIIKTLF